MNAEREELLISRIVDRCESPRDWDELERLEAAGSGVRTELWCALRADAGLRAGVGEALAPAARVALPRAPRRRPRVAAAAGWLLAALFAGLWVAERGGAADEPAARGETHGPATVVRARALDGEQGYELLCVRPMLERVLVDGLYELAQDEYGQPVPTPVRRAALAIPASF
jgi:hypothetical protein